MENAKKKNKGCDFRGCLSDVEMQCDCGNWSADSCFMHYNQVGRTLYDIRQAGPSPADIPGLVKVVDGRLARVSFLGVDIHLVDCQALNEADCRLICEILAKERAKREQKGSGQLDMD